MKIKEIKDKIYELEGLLELAELREDKMAELRPLIERKLSEINALWVDSDELGPARTDSDELEPARTDSDELGSARTNDGGRVVGKPVFCLNDRFRFERSIFGGEKAAFDEAMGAIAAMENYEEAERYFYDEMGLNADEPEVQDFMSVVEKYLVS